MVRVRFAPSPTGFLHIGGARTALFNWLFARKQKGSFILRIEDTDEVRSTEESVDAILRELAWLGVGWDEGPLKGGEFKPYFQMQRVPIYRKYAQALLDGGKAYHCYCSTDELSRMRKEALSKGKPPRYDGRCRSLSEEERQRLEKEGRPSVLRARTPDEGTTDFVDLIRGKVEFQNALLGDFVIMKSNGTPAFNFANVVDDYLMKITHVIRGDEHLSNTPRQIILYKLLGFEMPAFAHIPMILNRKGGKLSKRDGAVSLGWYQEEGYLAPALVNYLALLGWGTEDSQQVFETTGEMIEKFSLQRVGKSPAVFDINKLNWLNGIFIRKLDEAQFVELALPYLERAGLIRAGEDMQRVRRIILLEQERLKTLSEIAGLTDYFFKDEIDFDEPAKKVLAKEGVLDVLKRFSESLRGLEEFNLSSIENMTRGLIDELGMKGRELMQPVRAAVTGRTATPGLFDVLFLLGKERVLHRLDDCLRTPA